jgi:hypothetical protein
VYVEAIDNISWFAICMAKGISILFVFTDTHHDKTTVTKQKKGPALQKTRIYIGPFGIRR